MRVAYQAISDIKKGKESTAAEEFYACNKFSIQKFFLERHLLVCGHMSGIIYEFEKQSYNFEEDSILYPVSYEFVVAFHLELNIEIIFVVRSFNHTFEQLNDVGFLSDEILPYSDPITARQLRDYIAAVHAKKERFSISEILSRELKFGINILKNSFLKETPDILRSFAKQKLKRKNPIDWED